MINMAKRKTKDFFKGLEVEASELRHGTELAGIEKRSGLSGGGKRKKKKATA